MKDWILGALKSWTVWFNSVMGTVVSALLFYATELQAALPMLQGVIDPKMYGYLLLGSTVVNILLRFKTKEALPYK